MHIKRHVFNKAGFKPRSVRSNNSDRKNAGGITINTLFKNMLQNHNDRDSTLLQQHQRKHKFKQKNKTKKHRNQCNRIKDQGEENLFEYPYDYL